MVLKKEQYTVLGSKHKKYYFRSPCATQRKDFFNLKKLQLMFGNKKTEDRSQVSYTSTSSATNSLVQGTNIKGSISASNDIRIDGTLDGELSCEGRVIIGKEGKVKGNIDCQNAVIEGAFEGILKVKDTLQVKESAKIVGDVNTANLVVQSGASFDVSCAMGGEKIKSINSETNETIALKKSNA